MSIRRSFSFLLTLSVTLVLAASSQAEDKKPEAKVTYDDHVKPIFRSQCGACHNPDKKIADLDLTSYTGTMQGGGSGAVIEPGDAGASYLYMLVTHESEPKMPPNGGKIEVASLETIKKWIDGGARENSGSKPVVAKKPKIEFTLSSSPAGRPEGPPPMPERLILEPEVRTARPTAVSALASSPWAKLLAVSGQKQILLYNAETLELIGVLPFPEGEPEVLKFSRNGSVLLAAGGRGASTGKAVLYEVKTGKRITTVGDEFDVVLGADISSNHRLVALGGPAKMLRVYDTSTGELVYEQKKHTDWIYEVAFSPDGVLLASADRNGGMHVWEAMTGREYLTLNGHTAGITGLSWRADSNLLASCSEDASIKLWEMNNGSAIKSWGAHGGGAADVKFTRDGRLVSCGRDRVTKLWDQNGAAQRSFEAFGDLALKVTFSDETDRVIAGDWTGEIRVWAAADGKRIGTLSSNPPKLSERLDEANKLAAAKTTENQTAAAAAQQAQAALAQVKAELAAAQKAAADTATAAKQAVTALETSKKTLATATTAQDAATKDVAAKEPVIAPLAAALAKAQEAAGKASADKELAAAVAQFKALSDKRSTELAAAKKSLADANTNLEKAKAAVAAAEKQVAATAAAAKAAADKVPAATTAVKPAEEKAAAAAAAAQAAASALAQAQQQVKRWQDEIAYVQQVKQADAQAQK